MSRRIDVELTSDRGDGTWTWRAAGAKQPKGDLDGAVLPDGVAAGDVLRAEAEFDIDGITILSVATPKDKRSEPERLEILGSGREPEGVTTSWVEKKGGGRGDKGRGRGGRGDRDGRDGRPGRGDRSGGRARGGSPPPPERPKKPKPPRLRVKRTNRDAALAELSEAERPVAEQALKGGIPAVREALKAQNEENEKAGRPAVPADAVVGLAEQLLPRLKAAEWRDRAEAATEQIETVDLRDLRSVVTAADASARDDESRALADHLRVGLLARVEQDHGAWLQELAETLADGRVARALNLSSRPPKAGAPLPQDLADRLAAAASAGLTSEVGQKRWQTVLESVARSPVRQNVVPEGIPTSPNDELLETVRNLSMQVPQIAAAFDIEPQRPSRKRKRSRKPKGGGEAKAATLTPSAPAKPAAAPRIPPPPDLTAANGPAGGDGPAASDGAGETQSAVPAPASSEPPTAEPADESAPASEPDVVPDEAATDESATDGPALNGEPAAATDRPEVAEAPDRAAEAAAEPAPEPEPESEQDDEAETPASPDLAPDGADGDPESGQQVE